MYETIPDILTTKQCQELLSIGKNTMLSLLNSGELEAFQIKGRWRIPKYSIIEFIYRCS